MKVITSHVNADFDSLSSMVAAKKLYPDAVLVFPGSQEKTLRDFLIHSTLYLFDIVKLKKSDYDAIDTLVLVDTRDKTRIGELAKVVVMVLFTPYTQDCLRWANGESRISELFAIR